MRPACLATFVRRDGHGRPDAFSRAAGFTLRVATPCAYTSASAQHAMPHAKGARVMASSTRRTPRAAGRARSPRPSIAVLRQTRLWLRPHARGPDRFVPAAGEWPPDRAEAVARAPVRPGRPCSLFDRLRCGRDDSEDPDSWRAA